jgi:CRP-like cAMP-binding protein
MSQLQLVASYLQWASYKPAEVIFSQDSFGQNLHIIQSGLVKVGFHSREGKYLLLNIYGSSEVYGVLSFLDGLSHAVEVVAITEVKSLVLTRPAFNELLVQLPQLHSAMFKLLTTKLRSLTTNLEVSALEDTEGNLAYKLLQLAQPDMNNNGVLTVKISQEMLASALGWSRIWLNRTLNKFVDKELIQLNWGKIIILQPEHLKQMFG